MAGTRASVLKARETIKETYGEDFYANIGRKGGGRRVAKGFAKMDPEKRSAAGRKGGKISKRGRVKYTIAESKLYDEIKKELEKE